MLARGSLDNDASAFILDRAVDAAIDDDRLTSEIAGLRRAEVSTEIADLVRFSHSLHRNRLGEETELFVECYAQVFRSSGKDLDEAIGHYGTGRDIVYGDTVRREIGRNGFCHHRDAGAN